MVIDYDAIDDWYDDLSVWLEPIATSAIRASVAACSPRYTDDAREHLFSLVSKENLINSTLEWVRNNSVIAYHGSRLTGSEIESVKSNGLIPLSAASRKTRLARALANHPDWKSAEPKLDAEISLYGDSEKCGRREGQVHLTLSRSGLQNSFNHYLLAGSEFDQCVAQSLLGQEGIDLLARDGQPSLITVQLDGNTALNGAHPYLSIEDMIRRGDTPNIVREILEAWAYRLTTPTYQTGSRELDSGLVFFDSIAADKILSITTISL